MMVLYQCLLQVMFQIELKIMSEHVKKFIDNLSNGKNADAGEAFKRH